MSSVGPEEAARRAERLRIADLLHDEALQLLAHARQEVGELNAAELAPVRRALGSLDEAIAVIRSIVSVSHDEALEALAPSDAIGRLLEETRRRSGLTARLFADDLRLPSDDQRLVIDVVRELLTNVVDHARASSVQVQLSEEEDAFEVAVSDDGIGFDGGLVSRRQSSGHIGLLRLRRRVEDRHGQLSIGPATPFGEGTRVRVRLPAMAQRAASEAGSVMPAPAELLASITEAWLIVRRDGSYAHVSHGASRLIGRSFDELLKTPVLARDWWVDPEANQRARDRALADGHHVTANTILRPRGESTAVRIDSHRLPSAAEEEPLVLCLLTADLQPPTLS